MHAQVFLPLFRVGTAFYPFFRMDIAFFAFSEKMRKSMKYHRFHAVFAQIAPQLFRASSCAHILSFIRLPSRKKLKINLKSRLRHC
jgi:hypothetical protein